ncbi:MULTISPECIES: squalene/phytoene synthase family protein [Hyphobacterium]|uniref:Squalene/phytoene synthase family protein n=1 Tax=Hyphobacterium vulgare TaxID=1736751 RepID=A0ABV6ZUG0_9PROT
MSSEDNASDGHEFRVSDGELAALFAPVATRAALTGLHRWHEEIAALPLRITEPMIGAMRIEWHREAVEALFADPAVVRRNPVIEGLSLAVHHAGGPEMDELNAILDAHGADFEGRRFESLADLTDHATATDGRIARIAARMLDPGNHHPGAASAGGACGIVRLLRQFPLRAGRQLAAVPEDALGAAGLNAARLATGREAEAARVALEPVHLTAREALIAARADVRGVPVAQFPAVLPAALAAQSLKRLRRQADPYRPAEEAGPMARQVRLIRASLSGRI